MLGFRIQGYGAGFRFALGFRVQDFGSRVQGHEFIGQGPEIWEQGLGSRVLGSRIPVSGAGMRVQGS